MITREDIVKLDAWKQLTEEGKQYIDSAVNSAPSRLVGVGGLMNQSGSFASRASGHTLQWESRGVELVFLHKAEIDPNVICVWDQPPPFFVDKHDKNGRRSPSRWTPDYLTLTSRTFAITECKPYDWIIQSEQMGQLDWIQKDGVWTWSPGATRCASMGIEFSVFHSGMYSQKYAGNLAALVAAPREPLSVAQRSTLRSIRKALESGPLSHAALLIRFANATGDLLLQGLIAGEVYGALSQSVLGETFLYYKSEAEAKDRERLIDEAGAVTGREIGNLAKRLMAATIKEIERAEKALEFYQKARAAGMPLSSTDYRYRAKLQQAEEEGVAALAAFVHRSGDRGRRPYLPEESVKLMRDAAREYLQVCPKPTLLMAYGHFLNAAQLEGAYQPSLETFRKQYNSVLTPEKRALLSRGKRGFHAERPSTDPRQRTIEAPIPGLFAHIDCTPADVVATYDEEIGEWPRPIVVPLIDQESGFVLGRGYVFGSTSRLAPAIALNDTLCRNGCLPGNIYYDGGSEFNNKYLARTLGALAINAHYRPRSGAQWGARVESFFARLNAFLQQLFGGLANDKMGRASDGNKKGRRRATYEIAELIKQIDYWIFDIYNKHPAKDENVSPEYLWLEGRRLFPSCSRVLSYDRSFRVATAVTVGRTIHDTWDRKKGLRFGGTTFSSTELTAAHLQGAQLNEMRLDSCDPTIMYAMTSLGTIDAFASKFGAMKGEDPSVLLAEHVNLLNYHARARTNQLTIKCKEARQLKAAQQASRFCSEASQKHSSIKAKTEVAQRDTEVDEFKLIDELEIPIFEVR